MTLLIYSHMHHLVEIVCIFPLNLDLSLSVSQTVSASSESSCSFRCDSPPQQKVAKQSAQQRMGQTTSRMTRGTRDLAENQKALGGQ